MATSHDVATVYNDIAVLENMHVSSFFKLVKDDKYASAFPSLLFLLRRGLTIVCASRQVEHLQELSPLGAACGSQADDRTGACVCP